MKKYLLIPLVMLLLTLLFAVDFASAQEDALVMDQCFRYHSSGHICCMLERDDQSAWRKTVSRMVQKGARLKGDEAGKVSSWLAGLKPGSTPVCK